MILSTMGIKALYYAPINKADPTKMPTSGFKPVDVYQDTCTFKDKDPTTTTHKSETSNKKINQVSKEGNELVFSIMDPSKQIRADFEGGKYDESKKTYTEPEVAQNIEMALIVLPTAGDALHISCASISALKNTTYSSKGISLEDVTATPTYPIVYSEDLTIPSQA